MSNVQSGTQEAAGYDLTWFIPGQVLLLRLCGDYTLDNVREVNQLINSELGQSQAPISILIDAMQMQRPYNFSEIRDSQTYMYHHQLKHIYIATGDRLVKLAMMVIFNLSRAHLHIFDHVDRATFMLQRQLANTE